MYKKGRAPFRLLSAVTSGCGATQAPLTKRLYSPETFALTFAAGLTVTRYGSRLEERVCREEEVRRGFYQLPSHRILLNSLHFRRGRLIEKRSGSACKSIVAGWGVFFIDRQNPGGR